MDEASPNYTKIMGYIDHNPAAVLSTVGDDGIPHGAVVYVCTASHGTLCFVTKNQTKKYANIKNNAKVSLTFVNEKEMSTLQTQGTASVAEDPQMIDYVLQKTSEMHAVRSEWSPPVTQNKNGEYVVIGVKLDSARLTEFKGGDINGGAFTEL